MTNTPNIGMPLMAAAQSQKHVTHNQALQVIDTLVQLAVINRTTTAAPAAPNNGDRYIIAAVATGIWAGRETQVASFENGGWVYYIPREGWLCWDRGADQSVLFNVSWVSGSSSASFDDAEFELKDNIDATKLLKFQLSGIATATTRTLTVPNVSDTLAVLGATQTFTGLMTFSGTFAVSAASATIGNSTGASTVNLGTGATLAATAKTINIGTAGLSTSTTVVNIGSTVAGALGTTVINSPTVTFASTVTAIGAAAANVSALRLGLGGATADATNRLSINTPAVLLNNAGTSIDMTFNKNAVANDASMSFKTGFSTRGIIGLLGDDDFSFTVSPNGTTFYTGMIVKASDGRVEFPQPLVLQSLTAIPAAPAAGKLAIYARTRAGQIYVDVQRPSGRDFPLQPHFGVNRIGRWSPSVSTTINSDGMPLTNAGTVSNPTLFSTSLLTSMRRWQLTSAALINSVAEQRSQVTVCFRGNAAGRGGWSYTNRFALTTLQATGMGFFGLLGSPSALATTQLLSDMVNAVGLGFQRGTHTNWQMVTNDGAGAPTLTDLGSGFPINITDVLTLFINAAPNGSSIGVRVVNETTPAIYDATISADMPSDTTFLSPRNYMNNEATAAAVAFDCAGVYIETDY